MTCLRCHYQPCCLASDKALCVMSWLYGCSRTKSSIVLSISQALFMLRYSSAFSNGLARWFVIEWELSKVFEPRFAQVVRNNCVRWSKWNGIVRMMLNWVQTFDDVSTTCRSTSKACSIRHRDYMLLAWKCWPVAFAIAVIFGFVTVDKDVMSCLQKVPI